MSYFEYTILNSIHKYILWFMYYPLTPILNTYERCTQNCKGQNYLQSAMIEIPFEKRNEMLEQAIFIGEAMKTGNIQFKVKTKAYIDNDLLNLSPISYQ